jgi:serine phosphatase RsbU (regulator of sigma subunit)
MKIRTQLALASFLLSILPLAGIVLYSYRSSRSALEAAYHSEASRMARQMDHRLKAIRSDLEQRLAELSALPLQNLPTDAAPTDRHMTENVLLALGDSADLVDSLELQPMAPFEISVPAVRAIVAPGGNHPPPQVAPAPHGGTPPPAPVRNAEIQSPAPPPPPAPPEPILIDIPAEAKMPRFSMSEEQRNRIREISRLSGELERQSRTTTPEHRDEIQRKLDETQKTFSIEMQAAQARFNTELSAALQAREERRQAVDQQRLARQGARRSGGRSQQELEARTERTGAKETENPAGAEESQHEAASEAPASVATVPPLDPATPAAIAPRAAAAGAAPAGTAATAPTAATGQTQVTIKRNLSDDERAQLREREKRGSLLFGQRLNIPLSHQGAVVANLSAQIKPEVVVRRVLGTPSEDGELAFAADRDGNIYTRTPADRQTLDRLGVSRAIVAGGALPRLDNWIVALSKDPQSGLRVGVARPVADDLGVLRRAAAYNFSVGIALIIIALIGIVPVANHLTRDVKLVTAGAERIAAGDLMTRVPVTSENEFGQLAAAFNKMAHDLSHNQQTILEQERTAKEREMQQRMLSLEYSRKSVELEDARRFQLSMLPKVVPQGGRFEIAVFIETATEVGGDYYDFHVDPGGVLSVAVGDATGHGARAGTMVTVVKTLFASYDATLSPAEFLRDSAEKIKRMGFERMAMSLLLARFDPGRLTIAAAGMPPALVHRAASGEVDEIALAATPLGTLDSQYAERVMFLESGDTVLLQTDGFPELLDAAGRQVGYPAALEAFTTAAAAPTAQGVIDSIAAAARRWRGDEPPNDDVTFVVVRAV